MFSDVNFHQKGPILRPHYESRCRRRSWAWLVGSLQNVRNSGFWPPPCCRVRGIAVRLESSNQAQSTQLNRVTYHIFIHLGLNVKAHVGIHYPIASRNFFGAPHGALREHFLLPKSMLWENFFSDFRSQKFSYAKTPQMS